MKILKEVAFIQQLFMDLVVIGQHIIRNKINTYFKISIQITQYTDCGEIEKMVVQLCMYIDVICDEQ